MRLHWARLSRGKAKLTIRSAGPLLAVAAVVVLCGFTLYWTQSKLETESRRIEWLERSLKAAVGQNSSAQTGQSDSSSASTESASAQGSAAGAVRLARIVKCDASNNLISITYDPAQLFTGADAVRLAASNGEAVTGETYIFDPAKDVFVGDSPVRTVVTVHQAPAGWTGPSPETVAELATDLQGAGRQTWLKEYFWLHFNQDYIVSIDQYQVPATP